MGLSRIAIDRSVFTWMIMVGFILFGALAFRELGVSQLPDVNFPVVNVSLSWNGASPEVMENQVVDIVEDAIMGIQGIRSIDSSARQSSANLSVEFELDHDIDSAIQEIQSKIAQIQSQLPADLDPVSLRKTNPEDQPILWLTLAGDSRYSPRDLMIYGRDRLYGQFATISGVGDINLGGYVDSNLRVWLSIPRLRRYHLTAQDVLKSISDEHIEIPVGRLETKNQEIDLRLLGEAQSVDSFGRLPVSRRAGGPNYQPVQLKDVARIEEGLADIRRYSRFMGQPAIGLGILKQHGANAVHVADEVRQKVQEISQGLPPGMSLGVRVDNTKFIRDSVHQLCLILLISALFTSLICYLFLGSWTSTINVLMAIPTSIIGTFLALYFFKFTLNTFTLLGLSLAIGIVVDDAIMMLENIVRRREMGDQKIQAAVRGSQEISFAALASTLAVVAIFMPVIFMKGIMGRYFFQYGITVSVAVLLSLLEALTLTPMRCSRFLDVQIQKPRLSRFIERGLKKLEQFYVALLSIALVHRKKVLIISLFVFTSSLALIRFIPKELLPAQDQSLFMLRLKGPVDSSLEATDQKFREIEKYLSQVPEVETYFVTVGGYGGNAVNEGQIFINLKEPSQRKKSQSEVMSFIREDLKKKIHGAKIFVQDLSLRGFSASRGYPIEFALQGPQWNQLWGLQDQFMDRLNQLGIVTDLNSDSQSGMPEVRLIPSREAMASRGVSLNDVSSTVNTLMGGSVLGASTRYSMGQHRYDIRVRLEGSERITSDQIKKIYVRNNRGELIPLADLVSFKEASQSQLLTRHNRERSISIYGNIAHGHSQGEVIQAIEKLGSQILPADYHVNISGNSKSMGEGTQDLIWALILGIFVSYMVLASQFNSFFYPIIILLALPFSFSGAFLALWVTHQSFNMYSLIGLILLMGIVKKNSILLVDFTLQLRDQGLSSFDALKKACPARLRPILMTSVATLAAALPEALAWGPGSEIRVPMAVAIMGGVIVSTALTLFVVPCAYMMLVKDV